MPRISKVQPRSSRPGKPPPPKDVEGKHKCVRCGKEYKRQRFNFPAAQSKLFLGNNGHLPMCNHCMDELYDHYKETLGDDMKACRRMCMKLDIYWNESIYSKVVKKADEEAACSSTGHRMGKYLSLANLMQHAGKTYDDTLDEEEAALSVAPIIVTEDDGTQSYVPTAAPPPTKEVIAFWGTGFGADFYQELEKRYERWTKDLPKPIPTAEEALYKQIAIQEANINRNLARGKNIEQGQSALNALLGSLNAKPVQKKEEEKEKVKNSNENDNTPFGVWIRKFENERPVPEPDPELQDVDGIVRYIDIWFRGHLAKMLGIKNSYCKLYEDEMAKLRVDRPEYEDEDDETVFNDIFG